MAAACLGGVKRASELRESCSLLLRSHRVRSPAPAQEGRGEGGGELGWGGTALEDSGKVMTDRPATTQLAFDDSGTS